MKSSITGAERKILLLQQLQEQKYVNITDFAKLAHVSEMTVRRDLNKLAQEGVVRMEAGGAVLQVNSLAEESMSTKQTSFKEQKKRIAEKALEMVPQEGSCFLDAGTTVAELAKKIAGEKQNSGVLFLSNSLLAANAFSSTDLQLIVYPGRFRRHSMAWLGTLTESYARTFSPDVLFLAVEGIDLEHGLSVPDIDDGATKKALVESARQIILLADSSKFGLRFLYSICPLSRISCILTDSGLSDSIKQQYEAAGVRILIA